MAWRSEHALQSRSIHARLADNLFDEITRSRFCLHIEFAQILADDAKGQELQWDLKFEEAIPYYEKAVAADPEMGRAYAGLAVANSLSASAAVSASGRSQV